MPSPSTLAAKRNRSGMSQQRLLAVALDLLQEKGLAALSTRGLAQRLGVQAPALYWHVRNKEALLSLMADEICGHMQLPSRSLPFRTRLSCIASEYRRVLLAHRDAPRLFAEQAPLGPHRMQLYEEAVSAFVDNRFPLEHAIAMATFFRHFLLGMVTEEARQLDQHLSPSSAAARLGSSLVANGEDAARYPLLSRATEALSAVGGQQLFEAGLHVLLDGMVCQAATLASSSPDNAIILDKSEG